jgi:hypothetical protein
MIVVLCPSSYLDESKIASKVSEQCDCFAVQQL